MKLFSCSRTSDPDYTSYLLVFLVALGARIFFLVWIDEPILFVKYPYFADKLVGGGDIGERLVDLSPFYLYWMAFLQKIFGIDWATAKLIQSFIGALNALFVLALGKRLFNKTAGIFSALLYALYGNIIILESTLEPTVFILSFNLISIYFLVSAKEKSCPPARSTTLILAAGMLTGLSIITKPNALLFLPLVMGWFIFFPTGEETFHRRLAQTLVFCISASLMVMPVTLRNYVKLNDSVLVTADAGKVFYHGNSKAATALNRANLTDVGLMAEESDEPDFAHVVFRKTASRITGKPMSPSEASRFWIERTLHDIYSDPSKYFGRTLKKLVFFFTDYELHYIASAHQEYKRSLAFPFIRYGILASLGLLGMSLSVRRFPRLFLLYGSVGIYLLAGLLFLVQSRYRTPAAPYLSLFAGSAIYSL